ncbi:MAG: hypothetical protein ACYTFW_17175, partial [Planctomycetota bacterium]
MTKKSSMCLDIWIGAWTEGMRYFLLIFILVVVSVVGIGCEQTKSLQKPQTSAEHESSPQAVTEDEPLLLLDDEPLLLLEEAPDAEESDIIGADNSRCFV